MNREQAGMDKQDILRNYSECPDKTGIFVFMNQSGSPALCIAQAVSDIRKRLLMMCTARILNNNIEKNYEP